MKSSGSSAQNENSTEQTKADSRIDDEIKSAALKKYKAIRNRHIKPGENS
jgi:hypothetical protein